MWEVDALGFPKKMVAKICEDGNIWEVDGLGWPSRPIGNIYDK